MIWAAMSYYGLSDIWILEVFQDSQANCTTLCDGLLPFAAEIVEETYTFQQYGASIHRSHYTLKWLRDHNIEELTWPAKSPCLNIIENLWGIIARKVYRGVRRFSNVGELTKGVEDSFGAIDLPAIHSLYKSLCKRCVEVIDKRGSKIDY